MVSKKDLYKKLMHHKYNPLFISITSRCDLQCRHCSSIGDYYLPDANPDDVKNWLEQMSETEYKYAMFAGGEPFLMRENLQEFVQHAADLKMRSTVVTNGSWAVSKEEALRVLQQLPNLGSVVVSSDLYHLEFVDQEMITHLINACLELGILVNINITYATKEEGEQVKALYDQFKDVKEVLIALSPMSSWGAAKNLEIERHHYYDNLSDIPDVCEIRNHFINNVGVVYACCSATMAEKNNFLRLGDLREETFKEILRKRDANPVFNFIDKNGPKGLAKLFANSPFYEQLKDKAYTNKCDVCVEILKNEEMYQYLVHVLTEKENAG